MSKRVVIFTVSIGHGHNQVSKALQEEWEERGYEAEIVDIFAHMKESTASFLKNAYFFSVYSLPKLWDWTYQFSNCKPAAWLLAPYLRVWWRPLLAFCKEKQYDMIVTTHPLATQIGLMIKRKMAEHKPKLFAVLTDFSTHCLSISRDIDATFVAETKELEQLKKREPRGNFYSYGIPLRKYWDETMEREHYRQALKLPLSKKIVVISGGGEGVSCGDKIMAMLKKERDPLHVLWFLGKGERKGSKSVLLANGTTIDYLAFTEEYPKYLLAADIFISKPGGVSMAEALQWRVPTGILAPLPGQEKINQRVLREYPHIQVIEDGMSLGEILKGAAIERERMQMEDRSARVKIVDRMVEHSFERMPSMEKSLIPNLLRKQWS